MTRARCLAWAVRPKGFLQGGHCKLPGTRIHHARQIFVARRGAPAATGRAEARCSGIAGIFSEIILHGRTRRVSWCGTPRIFLTLGGMSASDLFEGPQRLTTSTRCGPSPPRSACPACSDRDPAGKLTLSPLSVRQILQNSSALLDQSGSWIDPTPFCLGCRIKIPTANLAPERILKTDLQ